MVELNLTRSQDETSQTSTCSLGKCDGSGWIPVTGPDGYRAMRPCLCREQAVQQARLARLFRECRIPVRFRGKTLDRTDRSLCPKGFDVAAAYVQQWEQNRKAGRGLMLVGPVGCGKSHLLYAVLQELVRRGVSGFGQTVPDLLDELRPGNGDSDEKLRLLREIQLLLLDDLGAQRDTEWVTERLFVILNARYNAMLPTLITSNLTLEELDKAPGWKRITDRILEMCDVVRLDGPSQRVRMARERRER